jgi:GT2 family glycosyltransferase
LTNSLGHAPLADRTRAGSRLPAGAGCEASIVIPSYNSGRTVRACLASVVGQATSIPFEVIVVDSSDDGSDEIIRRSFPEVRLHHSTERLTCGAARNLGTAWARGEYVLFVDTDCVVPADWVERTVAALRGHAADGVCGSIENGTPWSLSGTVGYFLEFFRFLGPRGRSRPVRYLIGGNSAYRRSLLEGTGFPDSNAGDDFDLSWRLSQRGAKLVFVPQIAITHHNKTGMRRVLRYQYALGRAAGRYRRMTSPGTVRLLALFPPAVALLPLVVLPWIAGWVVVHCRIGAVSRFLLATPAMLLANYVWAFGLMMEIAAPRPPR